MSTLHALLPEGIVRLLDYRQRFRHLGLPPNLSFLRKYRSALDTSQIELIPHVCLPNLRCVVDVGANVGHWSTSIAALTGASRVIAYEPVPEVFAQLLANTRRYPHICCRQTAVGSAVGEIEMHVERMHQMSSVLPLRTAARSMHGLEQQTARRVMVPITTLDEDLQEYEEISLLKVDVQGYEREVFTGAQAVLQRTSVLMTEVLYAPYYHGDLQFDHLYRLITSLSDMRLWCVSKPSFAPSGRPFWADIVFVQQSLFQE